VSHGACSRAPGSGSARRTGGAQRRRPGRAPRPGAGPSAAGLRGRQERRLLSPSV
jgi:hypothetical protein